MTWVVLRVRLTSGSVLDVEYQGPEGTDEASVVDHVLGTLADDGGVLRCQHGGRLIALFGRGVATVEVTPRGAVL